MAPAGLPPGAEPDISRGSYATDSHSVLTALALVVVGFRCAARITTSGLKADDYCMIVAMMTAIINFVFLIVNKHYIWRHIYYLEMDEIIGALKALFVGEFVLLLGLCATKVSVIIFLLNFGGLKKWLRWTLYANAFVVCASTFAFIIIVWTQCSPVQANWDPTVKGAHCISIDILVNATYAVTSITVVTDFLCVLLPLPIIWNLRLDKKTKFGLTAVIGLGLFAAACSIVRICLVKNLRHSREDPTWLLLPLGFWTVIELHVAMIVASLPPCRALAIRLWAKARGRPYSGSGYAPSAISKGSRFQSKPRTLDSITKDDREEGWVRMDQLGDATSEHSATSRIPLQGGAR